MIASFVDAIGPAWTWILVGLVLMGTELVASGVFLLWLGLAAVVTGLQILLVPMPWQGQLLLFAVLSVTFAVVASRRAKSGPNALNQGARGRVGIGTVRPRGIAPLAFTNRRAIETGNRFSEKQLCCLAGAAPQSCNRSFHE